MPAPNVDRNAYYGDVHVHTKYSFDAYVFGVTASPDDAYKYAKGEGIAHPPLIEWITRDAPTKSCARGDCP